ncbi:trehalose-phosphatase [Geobacter sp. SVR]|uniref:trehalose-phosphatase n=1 Tax=Geobacter sp. SVR TaxID=2495594 RepID=UPI00143EF5BA|nr:trehalose-phosphatase [Geobacter sp. SVR]BCS53193.1 trehalose 6-phosphate phosphatase [Geobacter sp. SVR]GCF84578.1 trehalose 6-phosphate phosphatase [Geobacter sp. SVR]
MTYLFSPAGRTALREFTAHPALFAFDLDGTLAPLVDDPALIKIPDELRERLIRLNRMVPLAIITGRACADARPHLGFEPAFLVGNHGAEGLPGQEQREKEFRRLGREWRARLERLLPDSRESGIWLEDKGATLSLHYRNAPDREAAREQIVQAVMQLEPLPRRVSGKQVENIVPADAPHKGDALLRLMDHGGYSRALFAGDDLTDEDVFRLRDQRIFGIKVGCGMQSAADYCLEDFCEMTRLFDEVLNSHVGLP